MDRLIKRVSTFLVIVAVAVTIVQGCAVFAAPIAEQVARAVEKYCQEPLSYREVYRNTVNAQLIATGHLVHVHCDGDPVANP